MHPLHHRRRRLPRPPATRCNLKSTPLAISATANNSVLVVKTNGFYSLDKDLRRITRYLPTHTPGSTGQLLAAATRFGGIMSYHDAAQNSTIVSYAPAGGDAKLARLRLHGLVSSISGPDAQGDFVVLIERSNQQKLEWYSAPLARLRAHREAPPNGVVSVVLSPLGDRCACVHERGGTGNFAQDADIYDLRYDQIHDSSYNLNPDSTGVDQIAFGPNSFGAAVGEGLTILWPTKSKRDDYGFRRSRLGHHDRLAGFGFSLHASRHYRALHSD